MDKNKNPKYTPVANPVAASIARGLASSGAAGTHAQGAPRERSRADAKRAAIRREAE